MERLDQYRITRWFSLPRLLVLAAWAISRLCYYAAGIRFDADPLWTYFQFIEPELLRNRLWESLYYLHMQPPGLNLLTGLILKAFPNSSETALHVLFMLCGAASALLIQDLARRLGAPDRISVPAAILFTISPGVAMYENLLIYEPISLVQLLGAALLLFRLIERPTLGRAFAFQAVMLSLMLVRNSFHLAYYLVALGALLWWWKPGRRVAAITAVLPLAVMLAIQTKNWILFGQFTASTWFGLNAGVVTVHQLSPQERRDLHKAGVISEMALVGPVQNLRLYKPYITMPPPTGIPVLDIEESERRRPNFNNPAYFQVHRSFIADARNVMIHFPQAYLRSVAIAWFAYFLPPGDLPFFRQNRERIHGWDRWVNRYIFGQWQEGATRKELRLIKEEHGAIALLQYTGITLMIALPGLFLWGLYALWRKTWSPAQIALLGFMLYNIASLTAVANFLSSFENNRYRYPLDGFFVVLAAVALAQWWGKRKNDGTTVP